LAATKMETEKKLAAEKPQTKRGGNWTKPSGHPNYPTVESQQKIEIKNKNHSISYQSCKSPVDNEKGAPESE